MQVDEPDTGQKAGGIRDQVHGGCHQGAQLRDLAAGEVKGPLVALRRVAGREMRHQQDVVARVQIHVPKDPSEGSATAGQRGPDPGDRVEATLLAAQVETGDHVVGLQHSGEVAAVIHVPRIDAGNHLGAAKGVPLADNLPLLQHFRNESVVVEEQFVIAVDIALVHRVEIHLVQVVQHDRSRKGGERFALRQGIAGRDQPEEMVAVGDRRSRRQARLAIAGA